MVRIGVVGNCIGTWLSPRQISDTGKPGPEFALSLEILDFGILIAAVKTCTRSRKKNAVAIAILSDVATVEKSLVELLREGSLTVTAGQI